MTANGHGLLPWRTSNLVNVRRPSGVTYFKTPRGRPEPWQQTDVVRRFRRRIQFKISPRLWRSNSLRVALSTLLDRILYKLDYKWCHQIYLLASSKLLDRRIES